MSPSCRNNWSVLLTWQIGNRWNLESQSAKSHSEQSEQCCTELSRCAVTLWGRQKPGVKSMTAISHPFLARARGLRAFLAASLRRFLRMDPPMVTSPRKECARFVDSSRRATNQVAWNAAGRSNQLEVGMLRNLRACLSRVVTGWFDNVSVLARTEAAGHFKNLSSL